MSMLLLIGLAVTVAAAVGGAAAGGVALATRKSRRAARGPAPIRSGARDALSLRPNDVVIHLDTTWIVTGRMRYDHAGQTSFMYRLEGDASQVCYLRARFVDTLLIELVEPYAEAPATGTPPRSVTLEDATFTLKDWGQVRVEHTGQTGREGARAEFHAYRAAGDRVLLKELWGDTELTLLGRAVPPSHLDLLPGDNVAPPS